MFNGDLQVSLEIFTGLFTLVDSGDNVALDEKSGHDSNGAAPDGEIKQPPPTEERKESEETTTGEGEQKPTGEDINEGQGY